MYSLINGPLMALFVFVVIIAGQLSNAFHVYDIEASLLLAAVY